MTLALRYAVRSDVGLIREGNEDSAYAGPRLLAIADGMGGHAAGEVASSVAISALAPLDGAAPGGDLLEALAGAVATANKTLHEMSAADPAVEGMGTTLTAMLWSGPEFALCHIGDSRGYLLRDDDFAQITRDHTFVQSLVDEGRLSPAAAASHPQRSLILRALDGRGDAEPDLSLLEARAGDRYLLCSDGLSDVVSGQTLHRTLATVGDVDQAVRQLVELAIKGGGPDNITCIVADVVDTASAALPPSEAAVLAGAASNSGGPPQLRGDSPAGRAHILAQTAPHAAAAAPHAAASGQGEEEDDDDEPPRRRWPVVTSALAVLALVIVGGGYAAWSYAHSQFYVGVDRGHVAIFRGINQHVAGVSLSSVYTRTSIPISGVPSNDAAVKSTIAAHGLKDAQTIVAHIRDDYRKCQQAYTALEKYRAALAAWNKYESSKPKSSKTTVAKPTPPAPVPQNCPSAPATATTAGPNAASGGSAP